MLKAKSVNQKLMICSILNEDCKDAYYKVLTSLTGTSSSVEFDGVITYDTMARIVDYLRKSDKELRTTFNYN